MSSNSCSEGLAVAVPWIMGVCFVVLAQQVLAVVVAIRRPDDPCGCARASATPRRHRENGPDRRSSPSTTTAR